MSEFIKFPDIGQFRNVIKTVRTHHNYKGVDAAGEDIYRQDTPYPILKFQGTVKLHGSNAAIGVGADGEVWTQSRNRVLSLDDDNAGFTKFISDIDENVMAFIKQYKNTVFYGEWCGGNIQKKVALNKLDKMFVIFGAKVLDNGVGEEIWHDRTCDELVEYADMVLNHHKIFIISQFPMYKIEIDFNHPELVQNELGDITKAVGDCCPVAKTLGVEGTGEGVVWTCLDINYDSSKFWFKVKDERHQSSKVKTLAPVDIEKAKSLQEFVDKVVTDSRLQQGIDYLVEMKIDLDIKNTGDYLRWIFNDILKEESDTMEESGIGKKDIGSLVSRKAKVFWLNKLDECSGLAQG